MRKGMVALMMLGIVFVMASIVAAQGPIITCPYTPVTPEIDGVIEDAWGNAFIKEVSPSIAAAEDPFFMGNYLLDAGGEVDPSTDFDCTYTIYFMWNDEGLFVAASVTDNVNDAWPTSGGAIPYWASDGLTVTFDHDNGEQEGEITIYRFMVFGNEEAGVYTRIGDADGVVAEASRQDIPHAVKMADNGLDYTLELQIYWDELLSALPIPLPVPTGDMDQEFIMGWKSAVLDPDDGGEAAGFGGSMDWGSYDPEASGAESQFYFGKLIFPAHAAATAVEASSWGQIKGQY